MFSGHEALTLEEGCGLVISVFLWNPLVTRVVHIKVLKGKR